MRNGLNYAHPSTALRMTGGQLEKKCEIRADTQVCPYEVMVGNAARVVGQLPAIAGQLARQTSVGLVSCPYEEFTV